MRDKPRDPRIAIFNRHTGPRWICYGLVLGVMSTIPLVWGPDEPSIDEPSVAMTMAFAVMGASTILSGFVMRHDRQPALANLTMKFAGTLGIGALIVIFATEFRFLQQWLLTTPLTGPQWAAVLGLALVMPVVVELDKFVQRVRRRDAAPAPQVAAST
jgi:Ca2+-transporting ATPase